MQGDCGGGERLWCCMRMVLLFCESLRALALEDAPEDRALSLAVVSLSRAKQQVSFTSCAFLLF